MPRFDVSQAAPHELLPACRLLFTAPESDQSRERLLSTAGESGLFVARAAGRLCGAALVQVMPGAMGVTVPPRGDSAEAEDAVTSAACAWLRAKGVKVCQAFAAADEVGAMAPLERCGFRRVTQLVFMRRELSYETLPEKPQEPFVYWPERPPFSEEFRRTLLATHDDSLDCPELNRARTPDELLAGFTDATPGGGWNLVRDRGEPLGVMIHANDGKSRTVDLTYFGIVPSFRGRGAGSRLMSQSLWAFYFADMQAVTLSVDARNAPAMKLYTRHGFVEYDRREAWLAIWPA